MHEITLEESLRGFIDREKEYLKWLEKNNKIYIKSNTLEVEGEVDKTQIK